MSLHITEEEWSIAHQAHEEVRARAIAENRRYDRDELVARMVEIRREDRDAKRWKARALKAEAELRRRATTGEAPQ